MEPAPLPPRFVRRPDGRYAVHLTDEDRDIAAVVLTDLVDDLDGADAADLRRLQPPAYLDDPDRDLEYQLLAGEELRASRRGAIAESMTVIDAREVDEGQLWGFLRSMNSIRLVTATRLGFETDDDHDPPTTVGWLRLPSAAKRLWATYLFADDLAGDATMALMDAPPSTGEDPDQPPKQP